MNYAVNEKDYSAVKSSFVFLVPLFVLLMIGTLINTSLALFLGLVFCVVATFSVGTVFKGTDPNSYRIKGAAVTGGMYILYYLLAVWLLAIGGFQPV